MQNLSFELNSFCHLISIFCLISSNYFLPFKPIDAANFLCFSNPFALSLRVVRLHRQAAHMHKAILSSTTVLHQVLQRPRHVHCKVAKPCAVFNALCLVPKFLYLNFTIYLSHQIFCLMYGVLNVSK